MLIFFIIYLTKVIFQKARTTVILGRREYIMYISGVLLETTVHLNDHLTVLHHVDTIHAR